MTSTIEKRYEDYKKFRNISIDYDEILIFYPDYYKTKIELEQLKFISKEEAIKYFESHYKNSKLYDKLINLKIAEDDIYRLMRKSMEFKYLCLDLLFKKTVFSVIELCELIDYIGHYPTTIPVPKDEEKNLKMENLLEQYDIIVRYHLNDELDKMQMCSDDVVRIIETLKHRLSYVDLLLKITSNNDWMFTVDNLEENIKTFDQIMESIKSFPLSSYQKKGKSKRQEGEMYLRCQYGNNII